MTHTVNVIFMAICAIGTALVIGGWVKFTYWLSDGELWGFCLAMSPLLIIPLAIAIYKDLSA